MESARIRKGKLGGFDTMKTIASGPVENVIMAYDGERVTVCIKTKTATFYVELAAETVASAYQLVQHWPPKR